MKIRQRKHQIGHFEESCKKYERELAARLWRNGGKQNYRLIESFRRIDPERVAQVEEEESTPFCSN